MADNKHTLRMGDLDKQELEDMADELDVSLAELFRSQVRNMKNLYDSGQIDESPIEMMDSHAENLMNDEDYRNLHQAFYDDDRDFEEFVKEEEIFETKWVDETAVDYEMVLGRFEDVVKDAQRREFDEAYDTIDELRDEGYEQEAFLLDTVVEKYRE